MRNKLALIDFLAQTFNGGLEQWICNGYYTPSAYDEIIECANTYGLNNEQIEAIDGAFEIFYEQCIEPNSTELAEEEEEAMAISDILDRYDSIIYRLFGGEIYNAILAWSE